MGRSADSHEQRKMGHDPTLFSWSGFQVTSTFSDIFTLLYIVGPQAEVDY